MSGFAIEVDGVTKRYRLGPGQTLTALEIRQPLNQRRKHHRNCRSVRLW
jgi:hypothetical protein